MTDTKKTRARGPFKVGDQLVVLMKYRKRDATGEDCVVTKVGRRWVTITIGRREERFDAQTMQLDGFGYSPPGEVYYSREQIRAEQARDRAWTAFHRAFSHAFVPASALTEEAIKQAATLLGIGDVFAEMLDRVREEFGA